MTKQQKEKVDSTSKFRALSWSQQNNKISENIIIPDALEST